MHIYHFLILLLCVNTAHATERAPLYFCTAANSAYYARLLNLIGSIHKYNRCVEIMVFDLGLTREQLCQLKCIKNLSVHAVELTNSNLLQLVEISRNRFVPGWYAWKPVVIKQALDKFPYVVWIDAGSTVLRSLDSLFEHIKKEGYFLATVGSDIGNNQRCHDIRCCITNYVINKFNLNDIGNRWILDQECVMAGVQGVTRSAAHLFVMPMYELSKDLRNFKDDGTAPQGFGYARYEQTLLSMYAYMHDLQIMRQDCTQHVPILLSTDHGEEPFYITWDKKFVCKKTHIYSSRDDIGNYAKYIRYF